MGAIGIYNQPGRDQRLTVLTIQLGITIGALYASAAVVAVGLPLEPAEAALPVIVAWS